MTADIESLINNALEEDIQSGDITTRNIRSPGQLCEAELIAKETLILSGMGIFKTLFLKLDSQTVFLSEPFQDGDLVEEGAMILKFQCDGVKTLEGERSGLNILQWLSGIATLTRKYVDKASPVTVLDTRKTTPGLRVFEKYAVGCGGGTNHRFGLYDEVMIKDNHIAVENSLLFIIKKAKRKYKKFEVEVENTSDAVLAAKEGATIIMLDNFSPTQIMKTIKVLKNQKLRNKVLLEASGGINSKNISKYGKTGVDIISIGSITNSVKGIDMSLEI